MKWSTYNATNSAYPRSQSTKGGATVEFATFDFFKFKPVTPHLIKSLAGSTIWCAQPSRLNDPFDCQINLQGSFARAAAKSSGAHKKWLEQFLDDVKFFEVWAKMFEQVGVCSFSLNLYNSLMWSHYADEHKGVCLLYRFSENFFADPASKIIGVDKVRYEADVLTDWLLDDPPTDDLYELRVKLTEIYLTAKAPDWSYEQESRIVRFNHGLFTIPRESLIQICFGLRTPEADIARIKEAVGESGSQIQFCQIVRDPATDFGITAVEL
ncbi:DUF2971 domain-containing protein [Paraburkholderia sp. 31.1]|uniref:DUF2971 domain-containing protein n=1 Tax=Paraburkholderia sp. 31.1 TaxID=2615205 RepID=UPI0016559814|nr:DUF2971 domain-containing protein [Paraburkholderia sp. 31.1]MBC8723072.1 DUF2971 domain-containing protein [Paraburkholderia sp. 31.1]